MDNLTMTLIRLLKYKDKHDLYMRGVPLSNIEKIPATLLQEYGKFFAANPDARVIRGPDIWAFMQLRYPKMKSEAAVLLKHIIAEMDKDVPGDVQDGITKSLGELRASIETAELLQRYNNGDEVDLLSEMRTITDRQDVGSFNIPIVHKDVGEMLEEDQHDKGIKWRLNCLNDSMRPLRTGDAGILAARVDTGKTTFMTSEASFMGPQIEGYFGERRPIVLFINEGPGKNVKQRLWQSALGCTIPEMVEMHKAGSLQRNVMLALGGWESVLVVEVHDRPISYIEDVIRRMRPSMVWTDMLDNAPFDGALANGGSRTDQFLEAAYQRSRLWAVLYDSISIATSQLSGEGEGELFPRMTHLANSKTGKPGAADFIVMSGASLEEQYAGQRWISLPKNKLTRAGHKKDPRQAVQFLGEQARYDNPITL